MRQMTEISQQKRKPSLWYRISLNAFRPVVHKRVPFGLPKEEFLIPERKFVLGRKSCA